MDVDRERVVRTLTFWLRPQFVLRLFNRFQKVAGFDRAIALASGALTATIPLAIVTSAIASQLGGKSTADPIIERYELTASGAARRRRGHLRPTLGRGNECRHHRARLPPARRPELHPRSAAAVRADLGARSTERPQHRQRAALDRRARALPRRQRLPAHHLGTQPARAQRRAAQRAGRTGESMSVCGAPALPVVVDATAEPDPYPRRRSATRSLGGPKPAPIRRRALSAWSRTWSGPRRRETSGSPPGSGSPICPGP